MLKKYVLLALLLVAPCLTNAQDQPPVADNNQNEVVEIDAPPAGADGVLSILRSGDKSETNHYISAVVELQNAVAFELFPYVEKAVNMEKGDTRALRYKVTPDESTWRYFIQVVTTEEQMPSVIETIKALDHPNITSDPGNTGYSIRMRYRKASEMAEVALGTKLSGDGKVFADDISNTLYIDDSVSDSEDTAEMVDFFDVPPMQVELDVKIVEISEDDTGKLGLDWDAWREGLDGVAALSTVWIEGANPAHRLDSLLSLDAQTLSRFLSFTVQSGTAKLLDRAKVTANNLTPATISHRRPDRDGVDTLTVKIEPLMGTEMVNAKIEIESGKHLGFDDEDRPIIEGQNYVSVVNLKDHQPLHLGTIDRRIDAEFRNGIPFLKSIPVVKYLFSVETTRQLKSRVYIIATPCFCNSVEFPKHRKRDDGAILRFRENAPHYSGTPSAE